MIARRLKALFSQISSRVVAWVNATVASAMRQGRRALRRGETNPVGVVAQQSDSPPVPMASNWLEDSRRLRGRPAPRPAVVHPATEMLRQILRDPHWTSAFEAEGHGRPPRPSRPLEQHPTRPTHETTQPGAYLPAAPSTSTPDAAKNEPAEAQRRLVLIRELVRRGLYNEGFKPGDIPDQYRPRPASPDASQDEGARDSD